jgi:hypothetical protein
MLVQGRIRSIQVLVARIGHVVTLPQTKRFRQAVKIFTAHKNDALGLDGYGLIGI